MRHASKHLFSQATWKFDAYRNRGAPRNPSTGRCRGVYHMRQTVGSKYFHKQLGSLTYVAIGEFPPTPLREGMFSHVQLGVLMHLESGAPRTPWKGWQKKPVCDMRQIGMPANLTFYCLEVFSRAAWEFDAHHKLPSFLYLAAAELQSIATCVKV
jgi:hypothetical protein